MNIGTKEASFVNANMKLDLRHITRQNVLDAEYCHQLQYSDPRSQSQAAVEQVQHTMLEL